MSKVIAVDNDVITFDTGHSLYSEHASDCCESHYLSMSDITVEDFKGMELDLEGTNFFERVEDYGIRLISTDGRVVPIPGYGHNNGYYSAELTLVVNNAEGKTIHTIDISECQDIEG